MKEDVGAFTSEAHDANKVSLTSFPSFNISFIFHSIMKA
jgi:hypothetical protein